MAKWFNDDGFQNDIVLKGSPFPNKMTADDAKAVIDKVETALEEMNYTFTKIDPSTLSEAERQKLVEQRFISPALAKSKLPCAAYISEDENVSIMVNEEDHIRIQGIYAGFEDKKAYEHISRVDDYLSERLDFAIHEKYGYLTSCLTNVGTGMRISYMVHLPAIVTCGVAEGIISTVTKLGATVRGMYGEGTKSSGYLFQISNQTTLGRHETEIADTLNETVNSVITKERELRETLSKQKGYALEDKIMRSYAILKSARIMQSKEMLERLSDVRLGISLGMIDDVDVKTLNNIMITASAAHITADGKGATPFERDVERAAMIREAL